MIKGNAIFNEALLSGTKTTTVRLRENRYYPGEIHAWINPDHPSLPIAWVKIIRVSEARLRYINPIREGFSCKEAMLDFLQRAYQIFTLDFSDIMQLVEFELTEAPND